MFWVRPFMYSVKCRLVLTFPAAHFEEHLHNDGRARQEPVEETVIQPSRRTTWPTSQHRWRAPRPQLTTHEDVTFTCSSALLYSRGAPACWAAAGKQVFLPLLVATPCPKGLGSSGFLLRRHTSALFACLVESPLTGTRHLSSPQPPGTPTMLPPTTSSTLKNTLTRTLFRSLHPNTLRVLP